jgi:homoserine/homoserine lactone efflux protein
MHAELYFAFILTTTILMLIPGPNLALIVANSVAHGSRYGLLTVAGTSSAMVIQLTLTGLGMSKIMGSLADVFEWLCWLGVAYLVYLGVKHWIAMPIDLTETQPQTKSVRAIYLRGFLISLTNPKTLFFFGAFFPQFLIPNGKAVSGQIILLSATFLLLAIIQDGAWATLAGRVRPILTRHGRLRNRLTGGMLAGAGLGLLWRASDDGRLSINVPDLIARLRMSAAVAGNPPTGSGSAEPTHWRFLVAPGGGSLLLLMEEDGSTGGDAETQRKTRRMQLVMWGKYDICGHS